MSITVNMTLHPGEEPVVLKDAHDPAEVLDYAFIADPLLVAGEIVVSETYTVVGLTLDSTEASAARTVDGQSFNYVGVAWLSGGTEGTQASVTYNFTTSLGRTFSREVCINVKGR